MTHCFNDLMHEAMRLTRASQLSEATAVIQQALGRSAPNPVPLPTLLREPLRDGPSEPETFVDGAHTHQSLTRHYKLYVPPGSAGQSLPLVVMLHGCTQDPADFAAGTGMNALAREQSFFVLYPAQAQDANPSRCWNWFKHNHQARERGEAALIATMTQAVIHARGIDRSRVYIAGLSAGGAMAAAVAAVYPELFAAVGVHSGLPPGLARSLPQALAAMRGGPASARGLAPAGHLPVASIVFHGDRDQTVHPSNGDGVVAAVLHSALREDASSAGGPVVEQGVSEGGMRYTRSIYGAGAGAAVAEHWVVHGGGHAWSGGQSEGSYTDPRGPDASREMLRFFFSQPRRAAH